MIISIWFHSRARSLQCILTGEIVRQNVHPKFFAKSKKNNFWVIVARNQKEKQINKFASLEGRVLSLCPCWHKCIMLWHQFSHITIIKYYVLNLSTTHSSFDSTSYFINKQISFCIFILLWTIKWSISYLHLCFSSFFLKDWPVHVTSDKDMVSLLRLKLGYVLTGFVLFVCYYTLKRKSYIELFLKQWFYGHQGSWF